MPRALINFLDGKAEFSIVKTFSSGLRMWVISNVDSLQTNLQLRWTSKTHSDNLKEDGKLVIARKAFGQGGLDCRSPWLLRIGRAR